MTTIRFNPLTYANQLKQAGFTASQAETLAQLQEEISVHYGNDLVTNNQLDTRLILLEQRLIIRFSIIMGSMFIASTGLILSVLQVMFN